MHSSFRNQLQTFSIPVSNFECCFRSKIISREKELIRGYVGGNMIPAVIFDEKTAEEEEFEEMGIITVTDLVFRWMIGSNVVTCDGIN